MIFVIVILTIIMAVSFFVGFMIGYIANSRKALKIGNSLQAEREYNSNLRDELVKLKRQNG